MHMLVTNTFPPVCFAMFNPVATCLAPARKKKKGKSQPSRLMEKKKRHTTTQGMPNGNRTPIQINLLMGDLQVINREQSLRRERLVDLEKINVPEGKSRQMEDAGNGVGGADTHDAGGHADGGCRDEFAEDGEVEAFCDGAAGEDDGCCAV
jgi:hypothetical protein